MNSFNIIIISKNLNKKLLLQKEKGWIIFKFVWHKITLMSMAFTNKMDKLGAM